MNILKWIRQMFVANNPEGEVLKFVVERRRPTEGEFSAVCDYFKTAPEFVTRGRISRSKYGCVVVDDDICGYEVSVLKGPWLDCRPAYYRLTDEQAKGLMTAILSCVPGSTAYAERFVPEQKATT